MESIKIILLCVFSAIVYGVVHDQITLRICLEYFTVGHPPIFAHLPDTLHAAAWGVVATWWMGLFLGVLAAGTARLGGWPKISAKQLLPSIICLLCVMTFCAFVSGAAGFISAMSIVGGELSLPSELPPEKYKAFVADWFAHTASYFSGGVGGLVVCMLVVVRRWRLSQSDAQQPNIFHA